MRPIMNIVAAFLYIELIFISAISISFCNGSSYLQGCIEIERQALLKFKQDLKDPLNRLASWSSEAGDCCTWYGVVCDNLTGHILKLNLRNDLLLKQYDTFDYANYEAYQKSQLVGKINPFLLNVTYLIYLDLSGNNFQGVEIPRFLGSMRNLRYLDLSGNGLQGMIPLQIGNLSNLEYLDISQIDLYAENFSWLSGISLLKHLDLSSVDLSKATDWLQVIDTLPSLVVLKLSDCQLPQFPPSISNFSFSSLTTVDLSSNFFQGPVPDLLQNLTSIRHLDLSGNDFNSSIPEWFYRFSHLEDLFLGDNSFQGTIPCAIGNLSSIRTLDLSYNRFEGRIPKSMGKLHNLTSINLCCMKLNQEISEVLNIFSRSVSNVIEVLFLPENQFFGHLTNRLGQFKNLRTLHLSDNSISGPIPSPLRELSSLQYLYLSNNKLNGTISEIHFTNLTRLLSFDASGNLLTLKVSPNWVPPFQLHILGLSSFRLGSKFPSWPHSQKHLIYLDISKAGILDTIPSSFWKSRSKLTLLNLSHNQIYGEIPDLSVATQLETLDLSSNNLSGSLPSIPFNLRSLDLSNNTLSGSLFNFLCHEMNGSKSSMEILNLRENLLHGELPDCWMNLQNLTVLSLAKNKFTGSLPTSIGTLSYLESLHLRNNSFIGTIPVSVENCTGLQVLDVGENEFVGNVPKWIGERLSRLMILVLRSNKFHGFLPAEICRLAFLQILDLAENNLSGNVPRCVGNFSAMMTLSYSEGEDGMGITYGFNGVFSIDTFYEDAVVVTKGKIVEYSTILELVRSIDFSKNNFSGEIPSEVTNLGALQSLNLSHNFFSGRIPGSIGALRSVESIDFSSNQLSGEIPQSISNLTFLSYFNLSNNNLNGKIPSGTQLQGFDPSSFIGNELCGPPLLNDCTVTVDNRNKGEKEGKEGELEWFHVGMAFGFVVGFWSVVGPLLVNRRWRYMYYHFMNHLLDWVVL